FVGRRGRFVGSGPRPTRAAVFRRAGIDRGLGAEGEMRIGVFNLLCWSAMTYLGASACGQGSGGLFAASEGDVPSAIAKTYCSTLFSCECRAYGYGSENECEERESTALGRLLESPRNAGLEYDAACLDQLLGAVRANGCAHRPDAIEFKFCDGVW